MVMECKVTARKSHYGKEGPWALPEGWCWTTLKEVCSIRGGKRIPKGKSFAKEKTAHVYIRVTDMKNMTVDMNDLKYIDDDVYGEISRYIIEKDDLYLTIAGTIGKVGEIPEELHGMNLTENAARLTDIACDKLYLMYALQTDVVQSHFSMRFHQVAQPKLSIETASSTLIALPPLFEQKRIVSAIQTLLKCIDSIEVEQHELDTNVENAKERILDLAIHGKLVSQDPSDEPAIELLKRINPDFVPSHNLHYEGVIPDGWQICKLSDLFKVTMGQSPDGTSLNRSTGIEFHQGKICFTEKYLSESDIFTTSATKCAEPNSLLCCVRAPVGVFNITSRRICIGRGLCSLSPLDADVDIEYWFYALSSLTEYYESMATGSTFKAISGDIIRNTVIAVPPKMEQQRILEQITCLFSILKKASDAI